MDWTLKIAPETLNTHLARIPLFCELNADELSQIAATARVIKLSRDQIVFHTGDRLDGCYCVMEGLVKLTVTAPSGAEKVVELVGQGNTFGEALLFLNTPTPVTAQAIEKTILANVPREIILDSIDHSREFTYRMLAGLSRRLHHLVADLESYCLQTSSQRVVGFILDELARSAETNTQLRVVLPTSKHLIASKLNLTPETFSRILHDLAAEGLIKVRKRKIDILDPVGLRAIGRGV